MLAVIPFLARWLWLLVNLVGAIGLVLVTLILVRAFASRRLPGLEHWHRSVPRGEFHALTAGRNVGFEEYVAIENRLFERLRDYAVSPDDLGGRSRLIRYVRGGPMDPETFEHNWNRTTELVPEEINGGVLLLHGLSDSPYSMRSLAEMFRDRGFYALAIRLPGHGTVPAGLRWATRWDWMAAARIGAERVCERVGRGKPFYVCGYSNGGALATLLTSRSLRPGGSRVPDRVFLLSPAIGVSYFARMSNWHALFAWIPYFERFRWLNVEPEFDPYKYNSFAKNAGAQTWRLTKAIRRELRRAAKDGRLGRLPPIMAFQSVVDATTKVSDLVELFDRLPQNGSELVVFDVNSNEMLDGFYRRGVNRPLAEWRRDATAPHRLTVIQNENPDSAQMIARSYPAGSAESQDEKLELSWPPQVFSLAHVAIPFPPDDPIYGDRLEGKPNEMLGSLRLRGEKKVLVISASRLIRQRFNPFHAYMRRRIEETLDGQSSAAT
jgi:alpha-beta hydrolase superfamily lysophospholipase